MNRLPAFWARHRLRVRILTGITVIMTAAPLIAIFQTNGLFRAGITLGFAATGFAIWARAWIAEGDPPPSILADFAAHLPPPEHQ